LASPDSVAYDINPIGFQLFMPVIWGTDGQPHPEVGVTLYAKEDPGIDLQASYSMISYAAVSSLGPHWVYATANVYGHVITDSMVLVGTYAHAQTITLSNAVVGSGLLATPTVNDAELYIVPCGTVTWTNNSTATVDVTFDAPEHTGGCTSGDTTGSITNLAPGDSATRAFAGLHATTWKIARTSAPSTILLSGSIVNKSQTP